MARWRERHHFSASSSLPVSRTGHRDTGSQGRSQRPHLIERKGLCGSYASATHGPQRHRGHREDHRESSFDRKKASAARTSATYGPQRHRGHREDHRESLFDRKKASAARTQARTGHRDTGVTEKITEHPYLFQERPLCSLCLCGSYVERPYCSKKSLCVGPLCSLCLCGSYVERAP